MKTTKEFEKRCRNEERNALKNMEMFWSTHGKDTVAQFSKLTKCWPQVEEGKKEPNALLQECLENSPILLITANQVEANMMVRLLAHEFRINKHSDGELSTITDNFCKFHFGFIGNNRVVHVQPKDMSSYTKNGSFSAIESVLKRYKPQLVISIGVAFGNDATKQNLGDVVVSKQLFPYDSSNKYSDMTIKLNGSPYETNSRLLCGWRDLLEYEEFPGEVIEGLESKTFNWYFGTVLSGGSVIDEVEQKVKLLEAAERKGIEDVVGGEMEGNGVYFACDKEKIPCIVIKGICDWGIKKNSWDEILKDVENPPENKTMKDCVQALAFTNAFSALRCLLEYDSTLISEDGAVWDEESVSGVRLFTKKSFERIMMKVATVRFLPYFIIGISYILFSFLFRRFPFDFLSRQAVFWEKLLAVLSVIALVLPTGLVIFSKASGRYKLKPHIRGGLLVLIFAGANLLLFTIDIHIRMAMDAVNTGITSLQFAYGIFWCLGGIVWAIARHLRTKPENLEMPFANIVVKNLNFEKCCGIIQNTSNIVLYSMSVGWICKKQLSPVQIHKCGTIQKQNNLLVTYHDWEPIEKERPFNLMPEDFCPITPDTLQVNYRMPNGDLVIHIITKILKDTVKSDGEFCDRYMEQVLHYRNGTYEKVLKRVCNSQIVRRLEIWD
ncbi:MAG: hypothetical protein NC548_24275 [Lachnospiraceae bacterium]|nr:hypothetical protein [Lachnospiraceae bacterium]